MTGSLARVAADLEAARSQTVLKPRFHAGFKATRVAALIVVVGAVLRVLPVLGLLFTLGQRSVLGE